MDVELLKFILLIVMLVVTFFAGMLPVKVLKLLRKHAASASTSAEHRGASLVLCLLTCFSGGVFFATCFLHLFPELADHVNHVKELYGYSISYPLAELLSCMGFFLLFFAEELILFLLPGIGHSHGQLSSGIVESFYEKKNHDLEHCCHESSVDNALDGTLDSKKCSSCTSKNDDASKKSLLCTGNLPRGVTVIKSNEKSHSSYRVNASDSDDAPLLSSKKQFETYGTICTAQPNDAETSKSMSVTLAEPEACERNCEAVNEDPPILMESRPHAHSHGVRSITFVLAISFHSIIEGLALGVQDDATRVGTLFISLVVHKLIVAFSVGLQLGRTHAHALGWVLISVLLFSSMSPIGGFIGMCVQSSQLDTQVKDVTVMIFQGLAVGTFIYVTFFEVLIHERDNEHPNLMKLLFMLIGFALIGALRLLDDHSHDHNHSHNGSHPTPLNTTSSLSP